MMSWQLRSAKNPTHIEGVLQWQNFFYLSIECHFMLSKRELVPLCTSEQGTHVSLYSQSVDLFFSSPQRVNNYTEQSLNWTLQRSPFIVIPEDTVYVDTQTGTEKSTEKQKQ